LVLDANNNNKTRDYQAFAQELAAAEWIQEKEHLSSIIEALRQQLEARQNPAPQQHQASYELVQAHAQLRQASAHCQELATSLQALQTKFNLQHQQLEELEGLRRVDRNVMDMLQKDNARHLATIQQLKDNLRLEQERHNETVRKYAKDKTKQNIRFHLTP
jgi:predicted RNase H-like nuclease (RuvC/YqgF family)